MRSVRFVPRALTLLVLVPAALVACGSSSDSTPAASPGAGGSAAQGGVGGTGGSTSATGGKGGAATGGTSASGGTSSATGGASGAGALGGGAGTSAAGTGGGSAGGPAGAGGGSAGGAGGTGGDGGAAGAGTGGSSSGASGAGGSAGMDAGGSAGAGGASGPTTTSGMCGGVPVLGQQGTSPSAECVDCVDTSCCTEGAACGGSAECVPYRLCLAACTTKACADACDAMYPGGVMPSGAFAACRNTKCAKPCQDMSCLGSVTAAMPTATTYKVTVAPADYQSGKPLLMATVKQCKRVDPDCLMPVDTQTVDAMGKVTFAAVATSPKGLDDYFEITAPMYEPTILFDVATSSLDDADGMTLAPLIITTATFKLLTGVIGATSDPTRGHITFLALACKGNRAAGVSVTADTADAMTTRTYIAGALPSKTAMETDASGSGAFINVPVGPVALTGTLVSSAKLLGTNAVFVRAGFITAANVIPTP